MKRSSRTVGNTLLQVPTLNTDAENGVYEILRSSIPDETSLLIINYRDGPDKWIRDWTQHVGPVPASFGFIHMGGMTRSAATTSEGSANSPLELINTIENPADLTELGIQISRYLENWAENGHDIILYFDSLTSLLQFVDLNQAYRFLHVLSGRVKSADGHAFYRLDPDAHESQTIATLQNLMDNVVDIPSSESS